MSSGGRGSRTTDIGHRQEAVQWFRGRLSPMARLRELKSVLPECFAVLGLLALIWGSTYLITRREYSHEFDEARGTTTALAKAFAESTARIISEIDLTLLSARASYAQSGPEFDIRKWARQQTHRDQLRVQIAVMDRDGNQVKSTHAESNLQKVNIADRPHFKYQLDPSRDDLYVSDPVIGRGSGEQTIQFTRKLLDANGSFNGIVVLSMSCAELSAFYDTVGTGGGFVALINGNGTIMARGPARPDSIGTRLNTLPPAAMAKHSNSDSFMIETPWDTRESLIGFRKLDRYPLAVLVGMSDQQMYEGYWQILEHFAALGLVASVVVLVIGMFWISQRRRAAAASRALSVTLAGMTQGIVMVDSGGGVSVINQQAVNLLRLMDEPSFADLAMPSIERLIRAAHPPAAILPPGGSRGDQQPDTDRGEVLEATAPDGRVMEIRITHLPDGVTVHTLNDITEQHRSQSRIRYLAHHDILTELPNRVYLEERITAALQAAASNGHHVMVMFIDLDGFKGVNDTLGHMLGDRLLRHVAKVVASTVGPTDFVARLGGDEFVVVRTEVEDIEGAAELAHLLIDRISESVLIDDHELRVSTSIGISVFPRDGLDHHVLFKKADIALYRAKGEGRATFRIFEPGMDERLNRRVMLEEDLRAALAAGSLQVHFQPQFASATRRIAGFEALVRWDHPKYGWVSPTVFVTVAEECGLIARLGAFVLEQACKEAMAWDSGCFIAVNVSAFQLLDAGFLDMVIGALARTGLPPNRLELELTESVMTDSSRQTVATLAMLRDLGVSLALDDFGTGYSSLSNLLRFRFDKVKIDKTFIQEQHRDSEARAILEAILAMGRHIGLQVTAEGVETEEQFVMLRDQGCKLIQGYLLGRAVPGWRARELLQGDQTILAAAT